MATYVFVHGAWLSAKCWEKVLPLIEAAGYKPVAVDYPGHGKNRDIPIEDQSMETYTRYLVRLLSEQEEPVILVGHSMGGMSISQASSRIPEKVKKLVYVTAFLPKSGQSCDGLENGIKPTDWRGMAKQGIGVTLDETETVSVMHEDTALALLYNDIPAEEGKEYIKELGKETLNAQYMAVELGEAFARIPKAYVRCSLDTIIPPELQDKMLSDTPCEEVFTIESGHSPYHSKPRELAEVLLKLA